VRPRRAANCGKRQPAYGVSGAPFPLLAGYYWQQADQAWEYVYAVFQAVFWPAYMVFAAFDAIHA
jgi:hypothetical protein